MATQQPPAARPLAIVTGASSGIGRELALVAAEQGFDLIVAADTSLDESAAQLRALGAEVEAVQCDLATVEGVDQVVRSVGDRPVAALLANAGHGLGRAFLDQEFADIEHVIDTNITGTIYLAHQIGKRMRGADAGRILFTGSIAGYMPGSFQAVYNASKAFVDSFALALRNELQDTGVTVTCLMPGVTDTEFFERADLMDTKVGTQEDKMHPAEVARIGFDAMMKGEADVVAGLKNKLQVAMAGITPKEALAQQHRKMAEPGSAKDH
ncbi:MAG TPA: SDR family NAD(P)-dependent oxidoreductase [Steroidobacteraceae bacterium]|jgi:short-subunit dehydrogenase